MDARDSTFNIFTCVPVLKWQKVTYGASKGQQENFKELVENLRTSVKRANKRR